MSTSIRGDRRRSIAHAAVAVIAAAVTVVLLDGSVAVSPSKALSVVECVGTAPTVCTFTSTGSYQLWTVPPGVTSLSVDVVGGRGGKGYGGGSGGYGARVRGNLAVTETLSLTLYVAGNGASSTSANGSLEGYNGGGFGANGTMAGGGGGGGASDIRIGAPRVVVAGGGGGGGGEIGGGSGGNAGSPGTAGNSGGAGGAGTASAGGTGGASFANGMAGAAGGAATGGYGGQSWGGGGGGGGGGGLYGGGGGGGSYSGGGGGGGSSYTGALRGSSVTTDSTGVPSITIEYTTGGPGVSLTRLNGSTAGFPYLTNGDVTSIGGACSAGAGDVSVTVGGNATSPSSTSCDSGTWTLTLSSPISSGGSYAFTAWQTDSLGVTGSSGSQTVTIDKVAPTVTLAKVNGSAVGFPYAATSITSVGGACSSGDGNVNVTVNGNAADPASTSCSSGSWTLTLAAATSTPGSYTFAASQTDAAGNTGSSGDRTVTIATPPPDTPALSSPTGLTHDSTPTFNWSDESASGATSYGLQVVAKRTGCDFGGTLAVNQPSLTENTYTPSDPLADGAYCARVNATNGTLTSGWSGTAEFTVDAPPSVTLTQVNGLPVSFPYTTNVVGILGGSCSAGEGSVSVTVGGAATLPATAGCSSGTWTLVLTTAISTPGSYVFAASQTDVGGNTGSSGDKTVTVAIPAPDTPSVSSPGGLTNDPTPTFAWTDESASGASSYGLQVVAKGTDCDFGGALAINQTSLSQNAYTPSSTSPLADGAYCARVNAGNGTTSSEWSSPAEFTIDATAPNVTLTELNGSTVSFPYTTEGSVASLGGACSAADGDVSVTVNGNPTTPASTTCSGTWTLTLEAAFSTPGSYTFAASQTDAAGNTGGSGNKSVTITAPVNDVLTGQDGSPLTVSEGVSLRNGGFGTFTDTNTLTAAASFAAEVCWNDGSTPDCTPATVSGRSGSFSVRATHTFPSIGSYPVVTTVTGPGSSGATMNTTVTVKQAPLKAGNLRVSLDRSKTTATVVATFSDANLSGTAGEYEATIAWQASDPGTPIVESAYTEVRPGVWSVNCGSHLYTTPGTYTITITIPHSNGVTMTATVRIR